MSASSSSPRPRPVASESDCQTCSPGQPELLQNALTLGLERRDAASDQRDGRGVGGGERIAELLVTGQALAQPADGRQQPRLGVDPRGGPAQPRDAFDVLLGGVLDRLALDELLGCHPSGG